MEKSKVKFAFRDYAITEFSFKHPSNENPEMKLDLNPSGHFNSTESIFELSIDLTCSDANSKDVIAIAKAKAQYHLIENEGEIPDFFYANSIAMIYPYIRAFVATVSLQSNMGHILLPTMNLMHLGPVLKSNTSRD